MRTTKCPCCGGSGEAPSPIPAVDVDDEAAAIIATAGPDDSGHTYQGIVHALRRAHAAGLRTGCLAGLEEAAHIADEHHWGPHIADLIRARAKGD